MPSKSTARPRSNAFSKSPRNSLPEQKVQIHKTSTIQEFISLSENILLDQVTDQYIQEWNRKLNNGGKELEIQREREEADDEGGHIYGVSDEERAPKRAKSVNEEGEEENPDEEVPNSDQEPNEEDAPEEDEPNSEDEPEDGPGDEEPGSDEEPEKSDDEKSVPDDDHPHSEDPGSDSDDEPKAPEQAPDVEESEPESEPDVEGEPEEDAPDVEDEPAEESEVEEEEPAKVKVDHRIWGFCAAKNKTGKRKGMTCERMPLPDGDDVRYCWQHCEDAEDAEQNKYAKKYTEHDAYSCPRNNGHNCGGCWKSEYDDE